MKPYNKFSSVFALTSIVMFIMVVVLMIGGFF